MRFKLSIAAIICIYGLYSEAKDFGRHGEVWEIGEKDAITGIKEKLSDMAENGELGKHNAVLLEKSKKRLARPAPVEHIRHTLVPREFSYDPSYSYPYNLKNHKGEVFYKAATKINPFDYVAMPYELIFFDGDDEKQRIWALERHQKAEIKPLLILVKGEPMTLSEAHSIHFYFDQFGYTTKKLGITQVPAVVSQEGKQLQVKEIKLEDK